MGWHMDACARPSDVHPGWSNRQDDGLWSRRWGFDPSSRNMNDIPAIIEGTNADLLKAAADLGWISDDDAVLDMTYGHGVWWRKWTPRSLVTLGDRDFRETGYPDESWDAVAFDPPYRLNGTPDLGDFDLRYGIEVPMRWQDKHQLIREGIDEALRILRPWGRLLLKCQDQVCSGRVRWQTREFADHAEHPWFEDSDGVKVRLRKMRRARLVDSLLLKRPVRSQPPGRDQVHARRNYSTLLILEKT